MTGAARLLRLSEADYEAASFLDERLVRSAEEGPPASREDLVAAGEGLRGEGDYIFHQGHVGSTLIARLLGRHEAVFCLREPALLRGVATGAVEEMLLPSLLRLFARVWRPSQRSLVKATSFVSELGPRILAMAPGARAILIFTAPQVFIASLLAGDQTRAELPHVTPLRLQRLVRRLTTPLPPVIGMGEMAGLAWACEICALAAIAQAAPERSLWLDFERFLADPAGQLGRLLGHLGHEAPSVPKLLAAGDTGRYAKAPEHPYDAELRRETIVRGRSEHAAEFERGLAWLNAAGNAHPLIAAASRAAAAGR